MNQTQQPQQSNVTQAIEISIRLGLVFLIAAWCLTILTPFISLIVWGAIIAVAAYTPFVTLKAKLGDSNKLAATLVVVIGLAIILIPVFFLSTSLIEGASHLGNEIINGEITVPPPAETVKDWPLIGDRSYEFWHQASVNLSALLATYPDQLTAIGKRLLEAAAGAGLGVLQFIVSMLIAAAFLANADSAREAMRRLAVRIAADQGDELLTLSTATVRSVAVGVIGIAVIQSLLGGVGMMFAGVPAAGLLAIIILVLAIAQLPPLLVLGPVAIYVFSVESTTTAFLFLVWSILVSFSDALLKPLLLGRGVDAPMLVILLGAIGGMITSGIVGLFVGAVVLALGYKLFQLWVTMNDPDEPSAITDRQQQA